MDYGSIVLCQETIRNNSSIIHVTACAKQYQLHAAKHSSKGEADKAFLRVLKYSSGAVLEVCFLYTVKPSHLILLQFMTGIRTLACLVALIMLKLSPTQVCCCQPDGRTVGSVQFYWLFLHMHFYLWIIVYLMNHHMCITFLLSEFYMHHRPIS